MTGGGDEGRGEERCGSEGRTLSSSMTMACVQMTSTSGSLQKEKHREKSFERLIDIEFNAKFLFQ
jgi:hypothetical protein